MVANFPVTVRLTKCQASVHRFVPEVVSLPSNADHPITMNLHNSSLRYLLGSISLRL